VGGVAITKDVYLGYTLLLLTTSLQLIALELSLMPESSSDEPTPQARSKTPLAQAVDALPAYIPIVSRPVFQPDARLNPSSRTPRFVMPASSQGKTLEITPETLRFLGQTVASLRSSIRDLVTSGNAVQYRFELQCKELAKQLQKIGDLRQEVQHIASGGSGSLKQRLDSVEDTQKTLLRRADRILQMLMDGHEPALSTFETQWFEELDRFKGEIGETGSGKGLHDRIARVHNQLNMLRKHANGLERETHADRESKRMGRSQVSRLEAMLADQYV